MSDRPLQAGDMVRWRFPTGGWAVGVLQSWAGMVQVKDGPRWYPVGIDDLEVERLVPEAELLKAQQQLADLTYATRRLDDDGT